MLLKHKWATVLRAELNNTLESAFVAIKKQTAGFICYAVSLRSILGFANTLPSYNPTETEWVSRDVLSIDLCAEHMSSHVAETTASKPAAQSCVQHLLSLHEHLHHVDKQCRHVPLRKAILNTVKVAVNTGIGTGYGSRSFLFLYIWKTFSIILDLPANLINTMFFYTVILLSTAQMCVSKLSVKPRDCIFCSVLLLRLLQVM